MKTVAEIKIEDVTDTYNGETGCACGCGGSYAAKGSVAEKKRVAFINKNLDKVDVYGSLNSGQIYELENEAGTRVTRVYVNR